MYFSQKYRPIGKRQRKISLHQHQKMKMKSKLSITLYYSYLLINITSECIICLERDVEVVLECTHKFCKSCIEKWYEK